MKELNPRIYCKDGVSLSVQANQYAYCSPRIDDVGHWAEYSLVEVGYIQDKDDKHISAPDSWIEHSDDGTLDSTVYGYVPTGKVETFIESHGGQTK